MTEDSNDTLRTHKVRRLEQDVAEMRTDIGELRTATTEHRLRLENGVHVFTDIKDKLPKPPSAAKVVGIAFSLFLTAATGLWALSNMLRDRPTSDQIRDIVNTHDKVGHVELQNDVHSIQSEQVQQRVLIEDLKTSQTNANGKLDALLGRTPVRSPRRAP